MLPLLQLDGVPYRRRRQRHVVELRELEKHYALLHACLQLASKSPARSATLSAVAAVRCSADETVGLLVDAGMFDVAVDICRLFDVKMDVVFEHLTLRSSVRWFLFFYST